MARKLTLEEKGVFAMELDSTGSGATALDSNEIFQNLLTKRETALDLSPELGFWFGEDVSQLRR